MKIEEAMELFRHHDRVKFILTGLGECEHETIEFKEVVEALEKQINGELVEVVRCKDCKHSQPEDKNRVYCTIKGQLSNNKSFCEAMEK